MQLVQWGKDLQSTLVLLRSFVKQSVLLLLKPGEQQLTSTLALEAVGASFKGNILYNFFKCTVE